jgi:hypothetical protein
VQFSGALRRSPKKQLLGCAVPERDRRLAQGPVKSGLTSLRFLPGCGYATKLKIQNYEHRSVAFTHRCHARLRYVLH